MGIHQVEQYLHRLAAVHSQAADQLKAQFLRRLGRVGKEFLHRLLQRVVHHSVVLVPLQPGGSVVPDFPQQVGVGPDRPYPASDLLQHPVGDLVAHVKAEGVHPVFLHPAFAQPPHPVDDFGVIGVELGHAGRKGKGIIPPVPSAARRPVQGPAVDHKPVPPAGGRALFHHVQPGGKVGAAVVEHHIQHHPDAPPMSLCHQALQIRIGAQVRVHQSVIPGVVPVHRVRRKDRVQIDPVDAQVRQIVQLFADAGQVAAKPLLVGYRAAAPRRMVGAGGAAAKSVRENLIPDCVPHPLGRGRNVGGIHPGLVEPRRADAVLLLRGAETVLPVEPDLPAAVELEVVAASLVGRAEHCAPPESVFHRQGGSQLLALAVPCLGAPQNPYFKGVAPVQEYLLHLGAGLDAQHQPVLIQGVAPGRLDPVKNSGKIHFYSPRCRMTGSHCFSALARGSSPASRHSQLGEPRVPGVFIRPSAPRPSRSWAVRMHHWAGQSNP